MSGPKKADVEAQLNIARDSQRKCANLLAGMEEATIANILQEVDSILTQATAAAATLLRETDALGSLQHFAPEAAALVGTIAEQARSELESAQAALNRARRQANKAEQLKRQANETFSQGERLYEQAAAANRRLDPHDRRPEMEWAKQAQALFDQAADELATAARARREAERIAVQALQQAQQAHAALSSSARHVQAIRAEAEARRRAEEEARRITEQQRREATLAVEQARAAFQRLAELPHDKFCPGEGDEIKRSLDAAAQALAQGHFAAASAAATPISERVRQLEEKVRQAQRDYERQRAEAEAEVKALVAAVKSADEKLLAEWSDNPQALEHARQALRSAQQAIASERFSEAVNHAQAACQVLAQALNTAAENKSADEKRQIVGQAVMDVLAELGFEVSYQLGSRTEPMRIAGQTPEPTGKGDIDIALPLQGEVNFEVNTPHGDTTCVATVQELQKRLAERGIRWETTDWGHAEGATAGAPARQQEKVTEQQKIKSKT